MASKERILYVVENDRDKMIKLDELKNKGDQTSIVVVDYGGWDFLIPNEIYHHHKECFHKFFDLCGNEWDIGYADNYHGYTWVRYVEQKHSDDLERFLACIYDEDYIIKYFPPKKTPKPPPENPPSPKRSWKDQPDYKKRAAGDYD